jgi:hypothetical protein
MLCVAGIILCGVDASFVNTVAGSQGLHQFIKT